MARRPTAKEIYDAYLTLFLPELRKAFLDNIQSIVDSVMIVDLADSLEKSDLNAALRILGMSPGALRPFTATVERAYEQAGVLTGKTFPEYLNSPEGRVVFHFDVRNSRAERWVREKSSGLVAKITEETRLNVQNALTDGLARGVNPRTTALDIVGRIDPTSGKREGGLIGLSTQQEGWSRSVRGKLETLDETYFNMNLRDKRFDATVRKAIDEGKALPKQTVERLVSRYNDKALKYRGDTIARTESIQAFNAAEYESYNQAVDLQTIRRSDIKRIWDSAGDTRVRDTHVVMDGQKVGLDEPFVSPLGSRMMFPGDISLGADAKEVIQCRCRAKWDIDWFGKFRNE